MKYLSTLACSIVAALFLVWVIAGVFQGLAPMWLVLGRLLAGGA